MTRIDDKLPSLPRASMRQQAVNALRAAIVRGGLVPGERLTEVDLATRLGISRAPVREALRELEHEGLVVSDPYRATQVLGVSQEEIVEVLVPIRVTVESFAFRKAQPLLDEGDYAALRELVGRMREAADNGDLDELVEADVRFHELVIERSGQVHCLQIWRSIEPRVRAYFRRDAPSHSPLGEVADSHDELLAALSSGDEDRLVAIVDRHIHDYLSPSEAEPS